MRTFSHELLKYLVAGTLAFLCDFTVFLGLTGLVGLNYLVANAAGFCVGLTISYLCCIFWVFSHRTYRMVRVEFPLFLTISLVTLLLGEVILMLLVEYAKLTPVLAKIAMTGMIFLGNFLLKKFLLFQRS